MATSRDKISMKNQKVVLFVRMDGELKNQLEQAARSQNRSVNGFVNHVLKNSIEGSNEQDTEPARQVRQTARQ